MLQYIPCQASLSTFVLRKIQLAHSNWFSYITILVKDHFLKGSFQWMALDKPEILSINQLFIYKIAILQFIDVDECKAAIKPCHTDATCINIFGSYICTCKNGYKGNGKNCTGKYRSLHELVHRNNDLIS